MLRKIAAVALVALAPLVVSTQALAQRCPPANPNCTPIPEIDGANILLGLGMVAGMVSLLRKRKRPDVDKED